MSTASNRNQDRAPSLSGHTADVDVHWLATYGHGRTDDATDGDVVGDFDDDGDADALHKFTLMPSQEHDTVHYGLF